VTATPSDSSDREGPSERSLELGLRRHPLTDAARARIRAAAEAEWRTVARQRWTRSRWAGLAAGLAALALITVAWLRPSAEAAVVGSVIRVDAGTLETGSLPLLHGTLGPGNALRTGERVTAHGAALVALTTGGTLRIARGTVIRTLDTDEIELRNGQIYVDLPPTLPRELHFTVRTAIGSIEHVGTQFEVTTGARELRVRVREGQIRLRRPAGTETAEAGTELVVPQTGPIVRLPLKTFGRQWSWVEALAPDFAIENRRLADFLDWAARETGRRLEIADGHTREVADQTRLHGSIRGLTPMEAIDIVSSATSLRFELRNDAIRVSSGG